MRYIIIYSTTITLDILDKVNNYIEFEVVKC